MRRDCRMKNYFYLSFFWITTRYISQRWKAGIITSSCFILYAWYPMVFAGAYLKHTYSVEKPRIHPGRSPGHKVHTSFMLIRSKTWLRVSNCFSTVGGRKPEKTNANFRQRWLWPISWLNHRLKMRLIWTKTECDIKYECNKNSENSLDVTI